MESMDDIKMAVEMKSHDEALSFADEAYGYILDISATCKNADTKELRKILLQQKELFKD